MLQDSPSLKSVSVMSAWKIGFCTGGVIVNPCSESNTAAEKRQL
jgi:hypothetical protein